MSKQLTGSAKKVQDFLMGNGFSCTVKELPDSTRTAEEAAKAIGCEVAQIAKSLIFIDKISGNPILVIASGVNQVDIKKIENSTGLQLIKADGKFVKERVGLDWDRDAPFVTSVYKQHRTERYCQLPSKIGVRFSGCCLPTCHCRGWLKFTSRFLGGERY